MKYVVEKGISFEKKTSLKYPFRKMDVGDSFAVREDLVVRVRSACSQYAARNKVKFSVRKVEDGFRCWRIA